MKRVVCLLIALLSCLFLFSGCTNKTAKVLVSADFANSPLLGQLVQAFQQETGFTVKLESKSSEDAEKAVKKGDFDAALLITHSAYDKLSSGEWIGGDVFYNTLYLVGPKTDPASVHSLGKYAAADVLRHLAITGSTSSTVKFVHPSLFTALGMKNASMWLAVNQAASGSQFSIAADDSQQMIQLANQSNAYAFVSRQNWATYGSSAANLKVLLLGIPGMMDQYTVLAKKIKGTPNPAQAFCQWMMGQNARSIVLAYFEAGSTVPAFESNISAQ